MRTLSKKGKWLMVLTCVLYALESVMIAVLVYVNSKIVECAELGDMTGIVRALLLALLVAVFLYLLSATAAYTRLSYLSNGELGIKSDIMKNILQRPITSFRGEKDAFYLNLLTTDVDMYRNDFLNTIPYLFSSVFAILSSVYMLWILHPWLLVAGLVMAMAPMVAIKPFSSIEQKSKTAYSKAAESYTSDLKENIEGYETIRTGCGETNFQRKYIQASENRQKAWAKYSFVSTMSFETLMSVAGLSNIVSLGIGGFIVAKGLMSVGMLFAAANYFTSLSNSFSSTIDYVITIRSTKKIVEKLQTQRQAPCSVNSGLPMTATTDVVYENVSFSFGELSLYKDFNYSFTSGGCYAVVGESGSGKSTLIKLLLKYFDGYQGNILLAGQDISKLSEGEVYSKIGLVNQSPYIFNASFYDNITMFSGNPKQDSDEYKTLLKELNLTALAGRVGKTPLGDFGDNISGGERQRINIARAMCRKPSILIFDEPTTGLDPENVALIDEFIFRHKDVTRIIISHNWSEEYLNRFDNIIKI